MKRWLDVEAALATNQASRGINPLSAADELILTAHLHQLDINKISRFIQSTGHSLTPLLSAWQQLTSSQSAAYIHYGAKTG
jgi:adenylosuccinate lyase